MPESSTGLIAVTGATGGVGGRVARLLAAAGVPQRLVVRDPSRAPQLPASEVRRASYDDPPELRAALAGATSLLLVSASEHPDRVGLHRNAVDAAAAAGVTHVVYTSFLAAGPQATFTFARDHWHTEQHLRLSGLAWTFLRDSLYQDVLPYFPDREGVIRGPAGHGRFAPVARDDVAQAVVAVLRSDRPTHHGRTYDLTGPAVMSMAEVAEQLTRATGRPVRYHNETLAEAYQSRSHYGAPDWEVTGWVTSYAAIATGELDLISDGVARITGRAPTSFADFLSRHQVS